MTEKRKIEKIREIIDEFGFKKCADVDTEEEILHQLLNTTLYEIVDVLQELERVIFDVKKVLEG